MTFAELGIDALYGVGEWLLIVLTAAAPFLLEQAMKERLFRE